MSNILSDLSNLKELQFQELSDEESQLVVGGDLFGSIVGAVAGSYIGSKAGLAGIIAGGLIGGAVGSVAEDFINDLSRRQQVLVPVTVYDGETSTTTLSVLST
jgi:outer membrane lipoprotein SlyB